MRIGWVPLLALALAGCGRPDISACEEFLKGTLRSPSTYQRVKVDTYDEPISRKKLIELGGRVWDDDDKLAIREVFVEYDAQNAYGAPVRGVEQCGFVLRDGKLPPTSNIRASLGVAQSKRSLQEVRVSVGQADPDYQEPKYPCCL